MKILNRKDNETTLRKITNDEKTKVLGVVGTVQDMLQENVLDYCDDKPERWVCVLPNCKAFFADSRDEAIATAGIR